jgi:hypothetical protein
LTKRTQNGIIGLQPFCQSAVISSILARPGFSKLRSEGKLSAWKFNGTVVLLRTFERIRKMEKAISSDGFTDYILGYLLGLIEEIKSHLRMKDG